MSDELNFIEGCIIAIEAGNATKAKELSKHVLKHRDSIPENFKVELITALLDYLLNRATEGLKKGYLKDLLIELEKDGEEGEI